MFTPLTQANIKEIVGLQLKSVIKMVALQNIIMDATPEAVDYLANKGYYPAIWSKTGKKSNSTRSFKPIVERNFSWKSYNG